jgi:hypothetical protein
MNRLLRRSAVGVARALAALLVMVAIMAVPAAAQVDPNYHEVIQDGHVVGQIFVPDKIDRHNYVEHWVLFSCYSTPPRSTGWTCGSSPHGPSASPAKPSSSPTASRKAPAMSEYWPKKPTRFPPSGRST